MTLELWSREMGWRRRFCWSCRQAEIKLHWHDCKQNWFSTSRMCQSGNFTNSKSPKVKEQGYFLQISRFPSTTRSHTYQTTICNKRPLHEFFHLNSTALLHVVKQLPGNELRKAFCINPSTLLLSWYRGLLKHWHGEAADLLKCMTMEMVIVLIYSWLQSTSKLPRGPWDDRCLRNSVIARLLKRTSSRHIFRSSCRSYFLLIGHTCETSGMSVISRCDIIAFLEGYSGWECTC